MNQINFIYLLKLPNGHIVKHRLKDQNGKNIISKQRLIPLLNYWLLTLHCAICKCTLN